MSTVADHGYVPEEHAPDPVIGHGDPTAPGKIGIWLFLASEIMFFMGILGSYIVLRSGSPAVFAEHAEGLNRWAAALNTVVLISSSLTMALAVDAAYKGNRRRATWCLLITLLCAAAFMVVKYYEYSSKLHHLTVVATIPEELNGKKTKTTYVLDGHLHEHDGKKEFVGYRAPLTAAEFDIHRVSEKWVREANAAWAREAGRPPGVETIDLTRAAINAQENYGPWRNIFYSCYYALTGVHGLHVVGGIIAIGILLAQSARGRLFPAHTEYTGLYWHFVDLVWIFLFPLLYLI